ncbi:WS/DGAT/MGAT family O-acyltransferase [Mycolicibacterium thermoresistibile]|uniref:WS/DGAT/MGAT family O-acyltransferase n=1 Tax=Mycolicibacterium thermoresistibile TaxID=1797 RepID=UPI00058C61E3|nr:wax ester/triacylglycerol synthase family O-acyltransferase [Mycolicibacterium thermoresistibile]MCV7187883.1 wax ester/triacylglycerol synthase family O-acyltransferase [Mycolicibacterium thermoresistibile]SNW17013.1 diacylglycerol O-acyltransferase [Mycolicibacterium thermoresistibile]
MERLSGLDAGLLYSESPAVPLHVCAIVELDPTTVPGGYSFERFRDALAARMRAVPELRAKLADNPLNLDHPVWVEDTTLDLTRHLKRVGLPAPGGRRELADLCAHIASVPLDRSKPLWEMWVIENLGGTVQDGTPADRDGPIALMIKVHHAAVDGVSAANLLNQLCDPEPDAPQRDPVGGVGDATPWGIAAGGLLRFLTRPLQMARMVPETTSTIVRTVGRVVTGTAMAAPFSAPTTPFNAPLTSERTIALAQLSLGDVKLVKNRYGVTVNDVVMALCAGALHGFLRDREQLPETPLTAVVPSSVRDVSDRPGRNQISGMFCDLHTDLDDASQRLRAIAETNANAKKHSSVLGPTLLVDAAEIFSRAGFGWLINLLSRTPLTRATIHNVIMSNVAGPPMTLYICGAQVKALYPLGPIFHGSGVNITVMSNDDKINVGILSCPQLADDLWDLADRFQVELDTLLHR